MSGANVGSFEAMRDFRAAVARFADEARDALATYDIELRRTLDWLLEYQPEAWKQEIRRSEDAIQEAKIALARCKMRKLPGGGEPSCMDEKKALAKAKYRLEFSQEKLAATRKWGHVFSRESTQYTSQATQLGDQLDADLPRALGMLDRALLALEAYAELQSGLTPTTDSTARPGEPSAAVAPAQTAEQPEKTGSTDEAAQASAPASQASTEQTQPPATEGVQS